jgi:hypothetical protein
MGALGPTSGGNTLRSGRRDALMLAAMAAIDGPPEPAPAAGPAEHLIFGVYPASLPADFPYAAPYEEVTLKDS